MYNRVKPLDNLNHGSRIQEIRDRIHETQVLHRPVDPFQHLVQFNGDLTQQSHTNIRSKSTTNQSTEQRQALAVSITNCTFSKYKTFCRC